jgi:hypothetical protein
MLNVAIGGLVGLWPAGLEVGPCAQAAAGANPRTPGIFRERGNDGDGQTVMWACVLMLFSLALGG